MITKLYYNGTTRTGPHITIQLQNVVAAYNLTKRQDHHYDAVRHTFLGTVCCAHDTLYTRRTSDELYLLWIAAVLERLT